MATKKTPAKKPAAKKTAAKKTAAKKNQNQTVETNASVDKFLARVTDPQRRADALALCDLMRRTTGHKPKMWGPAIVGFGSYHYKYPSGREGDSPLAAFSPRKDALTVYLMPGFPEHPVLMNKLGKFKTSKGCLYLKKLSDVDTKTLATLVRFSMDWARKQHAA